jgi:hypothetical protein
MSHSLVEQPKAGMPLTTALPAAPRCGGVASASVRPDEDGSLAGPLSLTCARVRAIARRVQGRLFVGARKKKDWLSFLFGGRIGQLNQKAISCMAVCVAELLSVRSYA